MATSAVPTSRSGVQKLIDFLKKWGPRIIIIGLVGLVITQLINVSFSGFSGLDGFIGGYKKSYWVEIREDLRVTPYCDKVKLADGTWTFSLPDVERQDWLIQKERNYQKQLQLLEDSPYRRLVKVGDSQPAHFALADSLLVNDTVVGEPFEIKDGACVTIKPRFSEYGRVPIHLVDGRGSMAVRILFEKRR